jgi:hypothetical protein
MVFSKEFCVACGMTLRLYTLPATGSHRRPWGRLLLPPQGELLQEHALLQAHLQVQLPNGGHGSHGHRGEELCHHHQVQ